LWPGAQEVPEGDTKVQRVGDDLDQRRGAAVAEDALEPLAQAVLIAEGAVDVPDVLHQRRHQPGLVELADAVSQQSGGKDDEEHAGHVEEEAQVDAPPAPVDSVANGQRSRQSQSGPHSGLHRRGSLGGGEHEKRRFDALADDGDEGDGRQTQRRAHGQRRLDLRLKTAPDVHGLALHPDDHPAQDSDGREHGGALEDLLRPALELSGHHEDDGAH